MTTYSTNVTILLILIVLRTCFGAQLLSCPQNNIKFEKLIGIRPYTIQNNHLLFGNSSNAPVTLECITLCGNNPNCSSFLLYYNTSECYSYGNESATSYYDYDSTSDTNVVWFRKTCLNISNACKPKAWAMEIVSGATFIGHNAKRIADQVTRQRCIELCLEETTFLCKSIKFNIALNVSDSSTNDNPIGSCVLSETNRHLTPNGYRVSRYEDQYIENECVNTSHSSEYCAYEEYDDTVLSHTDLQLSNMTQEGCQNTCDMSLSFNCKGYSIVPVATVATTNATTYTCLLHSEDSKLIGPKLLTSHTGAKYYERARCLNVSVSCTSTFMSIIYQPEEQFYGRLYTQGYSEVSPCYALGNLNASVLLHIPFSNDTNECGLTEARTLEPWNRILKSALLVIQYNALIQTQADRLIKVGCIYANSNDSEITIGASVNFTTSYPNRGSTIVNTSSVLPTVTMRIVDLNTKQPITDTEIGQELQMIIEITPGDGPYDIWAGNLIATSGNNTLQLLDENGCPTTLNIFSAFTKIQTNTSKQLVSNFQAFKFPSTPLVRFSVMVHFCTMACPPMACVNEETSRKRRKREITNEDIVQTTESITNATVYKVSDGKHLNESEFVDEMPLNVLLYVRGVNLSPDQLVVDENNRILIAGFDLTTNEVCIDFSLFVGLLVTWILLQVIIVVCCFLLIRKYKKYFHIAYTRQLDDMHQNFGFGSRDFNRRVHWADE